MGQVIIKIEKKTSNFIEKICEIVAAQHGMTVEQIKSKTRKREIVMARQLAMSFSKDYTNASLATIGDEIGEKDHATVLHACRTVNNLKDTDRRYRGRYYTLKESIENISLKFESSDHDLVCVTCGGKNVQTKVWADSNTKKFIDLIKSDDCDNNWCSDCQEYSDLVLRKEYNLLNFEEPEKELSEMDIRLEEIRKEFEETSF